MKIAIKRTKRPRDAYKATNDATFPLPSSECDLLATKYGKIDEFRYFVEFAYVRGFKRTNIKMMPPFYDTDVGRAIMRWNVMNGGDTLGTGTAGCKFFTKNENDALMMYLAFS